MKTQPGRSGWQLRDDRVKAGFRDRQARSRAGHLPDAEIADRVARTSDMTRCQGDRVERRFGLRGLFWTGLADEIALSAGERTGGWGHASGVWARRAPEGPAPVQWARAGVVTLALEQRSPDLVLRNHSVRYSSVRSLIASA